MKTSKSSILAFTFLFSPLLDFGQGTVVINGNFQPEIETVLLSIYKPVGGSFNPFYLDIQDETIVENSKFNLKLSLNKPGFFKPQSKGMVKTYFYAEPGDDIQISFVTDTTGNTKAIFSGNNAGANNLLSSRKLLNNGLITRKIIFSIIENENSIDKLIQSLDQLIKKEILPLTDLLKHGKISQSCYEAMKNEAEQNMLFWAGHYITSYFNNTEDLMKGTRLNKDDLKKLAQRLYDTYDPYNNKNFITSTSYDNCLIKSILIQDTIISEKYEKIELWSQYENEFRVVVSRLSAIDFAPDDVQMYFLGKSLLMATVFKPMSKDDLIKVFDTYESRFPNSPFNSIIIAYLKADKEYLVGEAIESQFKVYSLKNKDDLIALDFSGVDTVKSIQALIKKFFSGKPVFVDFWATWCSPCIAEFRNEPQLFKFLSEKNVNILYVSIDERRAWDNWQKSITKNQLMGFHYLANQEVRINLNNWFLAIPRYMFFDSKGDVVNDNLPRPSSKEELFERINALLK